MNEFFSILFSSTFGYLDVFLPHKALDFLHRKDMDLFIFYLSEMWREQWHAQKAAFILLKFRSFHSFTLRSARMQQISCFHLLFNTDKASEGGKEAVGSETYSPARPNPEPD